MPAIVSDAVVALATEQLEPLSVIVTVLWSGEEPVAVQLVNPVPRVIVGDVGTDRPLLVFSIAVILLPAASAPVEEVLKPTVQVAVEACVAGDAENVAGEGDVAAPIVPPDAGLAVPGSAPVVTLKSVLG